VTWFWLALGAAFCLATADFITKRHFSDLDLAEVVLARFACVAPGCLLLLLLVPWPALEPGFISTVALALPAEIAASFLYLRALQVSPLALTQPFLSFTPLFTLLPGVLLLGELPSWPGLAGMGLLVAGAYGLNLHRAQAGWAGPFRAIGHEQGSWLMLVVSLIFGYTSVMGRRGALLSSPLFMGAVYPLLAAACVYLAVGLSGRLAWSWARRPWPLLALALCIGGEITCHFLAISQVQTAYMIAVKRVSPIFAVLWGAWFLGEDRLAQHLGASLLLGAGAAVVLLLG
jgi:drug/metabolite transporter (DMT)-like permease